MLFTILERPIIIRFDMGHSKNYLILYGTINIIVLKETINWE